MGQEFGLNGQAGVFPLSARTIEMGSIPVNDDVGQQVEPGLAAVPALAWNVESNCTLQMLRLAMVHLSVIHSFQQARRCL